MIRRLGTALIGLALALPLAAMPVAAHTSGGLTVTWTTYDVGAVRHVAGTVTNHASSRIRDVTVTATWASPASTESGPTYIKFLAPHSVSPFHLVEDDVDVTGSATMGLTWAISNTLPAGGLELSGSLVDNVYTGTVTNESAVTATGVIAYGTRFNAGVRTDTAASNTIPTLAAGASSAFTITFAGSGTEVTTIAQSTTGAAYLTSWNNYFGDLGSTSDSFAAAIQFLADEGITLGCTQAMFCPKGSVTREQMALFLDRAIVFDNEAAPDQGFTDIGALSAASRQAINNLALAGVVGGCSVTPKKYCPAANVTRGQMSKFIVLGYELPAAASDHFTDDTGHFSEPFNNTMFEEGITTGCTATTYCPNAGILREQMAVFLFRAETP